MLTRIIKNTFVKIFNNLAKEQNTIADNIQIEITFSKGTPDYKAYFDFNVVKNDNGKDKLITLDEYVNNIMIDLSGGVQAIEIIIGQSGVKYAKELNCDKKDIRVILGYAGSDKLPLGVLMKNNNKVRRIDIENEFF